ncbi:MAG: hypothetical protein WCD37_08725 [Chloroflexia bacterium]
MFRDSLLRFVSTCMLAIAGIATAPTSATLAFQPSPTATAVVASSASDPYIGVWVAVDNPTDILEVSNSTYDNGYTFAKPSKQNPYELYPAYKNPDGTLSAPSARALPPRDIIYHKSTDTLVIVTHSEVPPLTVVYERLLADGAPGAAGVQVPGMPGTGDIHSAEVTVLAALLAFLALLLVVSGLLISKVTKLQAIIHRGGEGE